MRMMRRLKKERPSDKPFDYIAYFEESANDERRMSLYVLRRNQGMQ